VVTEKGEEVPEDHPKINKRIHNIYVVTLRLQLIPVVTKIYKTTKKKIKRQNQKN
jgi:hypothetical protein